MTSFLDRVVSKALGAADDRSAPRPRSDAAVQTATVSHDDVTHTNPDAVIPGETEIEHVAAPTGMRGDSDGASVTAPLQAPAVPGPVLRPRGERKAAEVINRDETRSERNIPANPPPREAVMPEDESDGATRPVPRHARPPDQIVETSRIHRTMRRIVREMEAVVSPAPTMRLERRESIADPTPRAASRSVLPEDSEPQSSPHDPARSRPPQHPSHVTPRALTDGAAVHQAGGLPMPASPRRSGMFAAESRGGIREQTTVHVTIGRLEIRAPQPAPVPRLAQTPREGHLENYLRKRASKGPR